MTIPNIYFPATNHQENNFKLTYSFAGKYTYIKMTLENCSLLTSDLQATLPVLAHDLPSIFRSTCFNEYNQPFYEEVKDTELGHLFEHILLEYLCKCSQDYHGGGDVMFRGETKWNWRVDPRGVFHIYVSADTSHVYAFKKALAKAIDLINKIIRESDIKPSTAPAPAYIPARSN